MSCVYVATDDGERAVGLKPLLKEAARRLQGEKKNDVSRGFLRDVSSLAARPLLAFLAPSQAPESSRAHRLTGAVSRGRGDYTWYCEAQFQELCNRLAQA